ncbi:MAG: class I SAM-dependent methyltransferase [Cyanobacteriota bacterium]
MIKIRSYKKELLDLNNIHSHELFQNLKELEIINKYLGGISTSLKGISIFLENKEKEYTIVDVGCGGGDFLKYASIYFSKKNFKINFIGYDLKQECVSYAKVFCKNQKNVSIIQDDFNNIFKNNKKPDIVHASLFFHHLKEDEMIFFIKTCIDNDIKIVVNDLERHFLAFHSIKLLTKIFSKTELVKNDAKLSVLRGFSKNDLENILSKISNIHYEIKNIFPFKFLILIQKK